MLAWETEPMRPIKQLVVDHGIAFIVCYDGTIWTARDAGSHTFPKWEQIVGPPLDDPPFSDQSASPPDEVPF